ncbi:hypothetical protein KAW50_02665 [candidate division WOR-3 bacterium]|nr:hypothetical protein [candidate division WOR-3 bacterium]
MQLGRTNLKIYKLPSGGWIEDSIVLRQGDSQHITPGMAHRFIGYTDSEIIEFSTHHQDSDSFRDPNDLSGKAFIKEGYDWDGVADSGMALQEAAPIITGRSFEEAHKILIENHVIYYNPVTYFKKNDRNSAEWKAEMIKRLDIEIFYEDNCEQVKILEKLCPKCLIVKV